MMKLCLLDKAHWICMLWSTAIAVLQASAQPFPLTQWSFGGRTIYDSYTTMKFAMELPDNSIVSGSSDGYIFHYSIDGELLETIQLSDSATYSPVQMIQFNDDFFLLTNVILPDSDHVDFAVFQYSPDLVLLDFTVFSFPGYNTSIRLFKSPWATLMVVGVQNRFNSDHLPWFAEISSSLELIRRHEVALPHQFSPTGATMDEHGNLFISGHRGLLISNTATLAKVDTSGTVLWSHSYGNTYIPWGYVPWLDNTHLLAVQSWDWDSGYFLVIDSVGTEVDRVTISVFHPLSCTRAHNGSVLISGNGAEVAKYNAALELQWSRSLPRNDYYDTFWGVCETRDHQYLLFGDGEYAGDYEAGYDRYLVKTGFDLGVIAGPTPTLSIVAIGEGIRLDWWAVSQLPMRYRVFEATGSEAAYSFVGETSATEFEIPASVESRSYRIYSVFDTAFAQGRTINP